MKTRAEFLCLVLCALPAGRSAARESEGSRENSLLLNGTWEFSVGTGDERGETEEGERKLSWRKVNLPGAFLPWSREAASGTRFIWARRRFAASAAQAESLAVLRWNRIASGAIAFLNGRKVGENETTGPYWTILPPGALRAGENEIVLKVRGAAAVPRSRSGYELIPAGFGSGLPEVTDDIWIDFADRAYMKWALAIPELAKERVRIRVTPIGRERLEDLVLSAEVRSWPDGKLAGSGRAAARLVPDPNPLGGEHFFVDVPMPGFRPWTFEDPALYVARVQLSKDERTLDAMTFRFGMREIRMREGNFQLNGKNLWLRGSNLVFEWDWGDTITGHELEYLVGEAREMSMNSFRTHTRPPPRLWADICDEHGTMLLAEFPVLYNYVDYKFTREEYEIWHRNVLNDVAGWMARLWNHPSVVMWVLSNESRSDDAWEEGPYQDFVNALDPTRPTMRTGTTGTRENYDVHACGNVTDPVEGNLQPQIPSWIRDARGRTLTVSEYMNDFGHPRTQWAGVDDRLANALAVAQIGAEHTEAMRRARIDGIFPYMYAGWTRTRLAARVRETGKGSAVWKAGYAAPESAAWHSALSPLLASLDLFDPNYRSGAEVKTDLYLLNDSWHDARVHVDLLLTKECPEYIPEAPCFEKPLAAWSFDFELKQDSAEKVPVVWRLPEEEGSYWLTARLTGVAGRPVLSQRFVRAIRAARISEAAKRREYVVLGCTDSARRFFGAKGLRISEGPGDLSPDRHAVVIWDASSLSAAEKRSARAISDFAERGGRVVVLSTPSWEWKELCEVEICGAPRFSRAFPYREFKRWPLEGIDPGWFIRWNGIPGTVAFGALEGPAMARAEKILWAREPSTTVVARVPAASGGGWILFAQLDLQDRVDPSRPEYDPVAERVLLRLLDAAGP